MKQIIMLWILVAASAAVAAPETARPQQNIGTRGAIGARMYDTQTVETIRGEIIAIAKVAHHDRRAYGVHLLLKTAAGTVSVHLGPSWFIVRQRIKLRPDDRIEVTGSRITYRDRPVVIAAQIRKGHQSMVLRDSRGFPLWSGARGR
jgi:hypothetical protein